MPDTEEGNTDIEIAEASYIKIPVGLLMILYAGLAKESAIIRERYQPAIRDLLRKGELS